MLVRVTKNKEKRAAANELSLIACHYGGYDELRRSATRRSVAEWDKQSAYPDEALFLELVCPGQEPCFCQGDFPQWLHYIRMNGRKRNLNIFQKESLWNLAARLTSSPFMLFIDADVYPVNCTDWFTRLRDAGCVGTVTHPTTFLLEEGWGTGGSDLQYISMMVAPDTKSYYRDKGMYAFPGLGYVLARSDWQAMGGFNTYGITGSGDSVFLYECCPSIRQPFGYAHRYHESILRKGLPQLKVAALPDVTLRHCFHGAHQDRAYQFSREIISLLGIPHAMCYVDNAGLMAWRDPECLLAQVCNNAKSRMKTKAELMELLAETVSKRLDLLVSDKLLYNPEDYTND